MDYVSLTRVLQNIFGIAVLLSTWLPHNNTNAAYQIWECDTFFTCI